MSTIPATILSGLQNGEIVGCFRANGYWHVSLMIPEEEEEEPVTATAPQYTKMAVWELANLSLRRGLSYTQSNKKDFIDKLREQDATGSVPTVQVPDWTGIINYDTLKWCELYEIAHKRKIQLRDNGKRWRRDDLIEKLRTLD